MRAILAMQLVFFFFAGAMLDEKMKEAKAGCECKRLLTMSLKELGEERIL